VTVRDMPDVTISTRQLMRIIIMLISLWSFTAGMVLLAFPSSDALGAGLADRAGQRLIGVHLVLLSPIYLLIAMKQEQYGNLVWLPIAGQTCFALTVAYNIVSGDTDFKDGALATLISLIFAGLLTFIWITEQRTIARNKMLADTDVESLTSRGELGADDEDLSLGP
jgi:hypothetical protein